MRILFLTDNFPPEVNAPATRTYEHCKEWTKEGVDVTVVTCAPNFPEGKLYRGYKNKLYQQELIDGIKVIRVWSYISPNEGLIRRALDYFSFALLAFLSSLFIKTDLIIATSPQFFTAISGSMLAFLKRKPWIMEVRDLWPESIVAVGAMKRNFTINFFEKLEKRLYRSASHIVVVTDNFKKIISNYGISSKKISVFKNGVNLDFFSPSEKPAFLVEKYNLKDKFIIAYIGTLGMSHGLDFILSNIKELDRTYPQIIFLFVGSGAEKQNLVTKAQKLNLKNVLFIDAVSKAEVLNYLNLMDVSLVNLKKTETFKSVIPSKIFEAAAVRKPILLGLEGESKQLIEHYNAGKCFTPEDKLSFVNSAIEMYTNKELYHQYLAGCETLARDFDRQIIARNMLKRVKSVLLEG